MTCSHPCPRLTRRCVLWLALLLPVSVARADGPGVDLGRMMLLPEGWSFNFERDIVPILSRHGCNGSGCHGKAEGQNGFKLSVFGFDPAADYVSLLREGRGRRISLTRPEQSLLLAKVSGVVPHGGGVRLAKDSPEYSMLRRWIETGAALGVTTDPQVTSIQMAATQRAASAFTFGEKFALQVIATYSDGKRMDVTPLTRFQSNHEALATIDENGGVTVGTTPGDVAVMAAFMGRVDVLRVLIPQTEPTTGLTAPPANNLIDELVDAKLRLLNIVPSELCDDADFQRRVTLDVTGRLPTADRAKRFLEEGSPDKRMRLVEELLAQPAYADYWTMRWADSLRIDRGVLGHKGAHDYSEWLRDGFARNRPWNEVVTELLTASGPLQTAPAGQFYRAVTRPGARASTLSQVFLGIRIECAQCHHHPADRWSQTDYAAMESFFVQPVTRPTVVGDFLSVDLDAKDAKHPRTGELIPASALGQPLPMASPEGDRRAALAAWMTDPANPWFAKNFVNRTWAQLVGRGLIEPVDDVRSTNPPSNPELLEALAQHFIASGYDVKDLMRWIIASRTYQLSTHTNLSNVHDEQNFSRAVLRPLDAEVLLDAICDTTGVPEKFDGVPAGSRAVQLWDSQVPSEFLKIFGRPTRSTVCSCERVSEPNVAQVLKVMNSPLVQDKLRHAGGRVQGWAASSSDNAELVSQTYLTFFGRLPSSPEREAALQFLGQQTDRQRALEDLAWSLLNSTEFVFNH